MEPTWWSKSPSEDNRVQRPKAEVAADRGRGIDHWEPPEFATNADRGSSQAKQPKESPQQQVMLETREVWIAWSRQKNASWESRTIADSHSRHNRSSHRAGHSSCKSCHECCEDEQHWRRQKEMAGSCGL
jgi:hypothetical protein